MFIRTSMESLSSEITASGTSFSNALRLFVTFSHGKNMQFRYLGDLRNWPPETNYRCVEIEGCNHGSEIPPTTNEGVWSVSKLGKLPLPNITADKCMIDSVKSPSLDDDEL